LRCHRLQHHRIDDRVADKRGQREPHRERIDAEIEQRESGAPDHRREKHRLQRRDLTARHGTRAGARHQRIDLDLDQAIDGGRGARDQRDAEGGGKRCRREARIEHRPGTARNMPITAQKTISETTRGLVSARNCVSRDVVCCQVMEVINGLCKMYRCREPRAAGSSKVHRAE
jgi:hypothetical protein